ncbi:DUF6378 domain-containing protein [Hominenteromicrobium sp.]|uniref:DUF6378 domain-containing protein n=1 Tax=Hominenteromicrobium sp. TaxID=3073581 RepID=UPI003AF0EBD7
MKNEDEKLREAARMLSVNCEGYRDGCEGCLFCRDNLSCKIDGIPMWWDSDFGLDHSAGTGKKVGDRMVEVSKTIDSIVGAPTDTPTATDTPTDTPTTRAEILDAAKKIVTGDREKQYGKPEDNFDVIARLWTTYAGHSFTAVDVAVMMTLLKVARIKTGHYKTDSYVDACGYLACAAEIAEGLI